MLLLLLIVVPVVVVVVPVMAVTPGQLKTQEAGLAYFSKNAIFTAR